MVNTLYLLHQIDSELLRLRGEATNLIVVARELSGSIENLPGMESAHALLDGVVERMGKYVRLAPSLGLYQN